MSVAAVKAAGVALVMEPFPSVCIACLASLWFTVVPHSAFTPVARLCHMTSAASTLLTTVSLALRVMEWQAVTTAVCFILHCLALVRVTCFPVRGATQVSPAVAAALQSAQHGAPPGKARDGLRQRRQRPGDDTTGDADDTGAEGLPEIVVAPQQRFAILPTLGCLLLIFYACSVVTVFSMAIMAELSQPYPDHDVVDH